jgi:hypothetical protein
VAGDAKVGIKDLLWPSKKMEPVDTTRRTNSQTIRHGEKSADSNSPSASPPPSGTTLSVSDEEWINAQRAIRQAGGAACFYLITTDILGPFGLAYSFATVGWAYVCLHSATAWDQLTIHTAPVLFCSPSLPSWPDTLDTSNGKCSCGRTASATLR